MTSPVPSTAASSTPAPIKDVICQNGIFELPNGKKYQVSYLRIGGKEIVGGAAGNSSNPVLNNAQLQESIKNILRTVWKDQETQKALTEKPFESFDVTIEGDKEENRKVSVSGTDQAAKEVFKTNTVTYDSIKKFHLELIGEVKKLEITEQAKKATSTKPSTPQSPKKPKIVKPTPQRTDNVQLNVPDIDLDGDVTPKSKPKKPSDSSASAAAKT